MNKPPRFSPVRPLFAAFTLMGLASIGLSAHPATLDIGRWVGFAHAGDSTNPGTNAVLDLAGSTSPSEVAHLQGTLSLLPAVQSTLTATGAVSSSGKLTLVLHAEGLTGLCDGSVRNLDGFTREGDPDAVADLNFSLKNAAGAVVRGHINLIHLYGGADWASVASPGFSGFARGAFLPPRANLAGASSFQATAQQGSFFAGNLNLADLQFQAVGTVNDQGSTIVLADGSVQPDPNRPRALIGLLFSGGVALASEGPLQLVGRYGQGPFAALLPAVQKARDGAASFNWQPAS